MLSPRQNMIISTMYRQQDWITGKDLARLLNVSDRTIRNDIVAINHFYEDTVIVSNLKKGYCVQDDKLKKLIHPTDKQLPETIEERKLFILKKLLTSRQPINLYELASEMFVSEFSLENDINKIRKLLKKYPGLKINKHNNTIKLSGDEYTKRQLYKELILSNINGNILNLNKIAEKFSNFDLLKVKDILKNIFSENQYEINEIQIPSMVIHIGVVLERNLSYHFLANTECSNTIHETKEYKISKQFFEKISSTLILKITEAEILDFALYLKRGKKKGYGEKERLEEIASELVQHITDEIKEYFDIDFSEDREFRLGLELHINSLLRRHYEKIEIDNTCLEEVKRKYSFIFEMGVWVCKIIEERLKITISENEISFIALHIGSAYERANLKKKYRCILICPHNKLISDLCIQKIVNRFGERMEIVDCMSYFEEIDILKNNPDFILTTQPLSHTLEIMTSEISMFFDYKDESVVFQLLNRLDQIRYKNNFQFFILNLIRKEIFTVNLDEDQPEEIISSMCDNLYLRGYVKEGFKESVLKREALSSTSFFHGFALPHNMSNQFTIHSAIGTAILKKPVKWGQYDVRFVLLLAITEENRNFLKIFFDWLDGVVTNPEKFSKLLEVQDYKGFVDTLL